MADFDELKLTVSLTDDASAGLAAIRTQLTQLVQTAGQAQKSLSGVAAAATQVGQAHAQAHPHVTRHDRALKELQHSAEETTRGLLQMGLSVRQGVGGFAQLALGAREAFVGMQGASVAMGELGVASEAMVIGLGAVTLGIAAIGAAVAAYSISVFRFSQEMYTLNQTARSLGMSFGQLRGITEQNERFGISVAQTTSELANMNEALTDLSMSGSKLRQELVQQGVPARMIDDYTRLTNSVDRYNEVRRWEKTIVDRYTAQGHPEIGATVAAHLGQKMGVAGDAYLRPEREHQTAAQVLANDRIAKQSEQIAEQWRETGRLVTEIKNAILSWGLPAIGPIIAGINEGLKSTLGMFEGIGRIITAIKNAAPDWLTRAIGMGYRMETGALGGLITGGPVGAVRGAYRNAPGRPSPFRRRGQRQRRCPNVALVEFAKQEPARWFSSGCHRASIERRFCHGRHAVHRRRGWPGDHGAGWWTRRWHRQWKHHARKGD